MTIMPMTPLMTGVTLRSSEEINWQSRTFFNYYFSYMENDSFRNGKGRKWKSSILLDSDSVKFMIPLPIFDFQKVIRVLTLLD